jgi:PAS domain S-box-containing protein
MDLLNQKSFWENNLRVIIYYLASFLVSYFLITLNNFPYIFWFPFVISTSYILVKGFRVLSGFLVISFSAHLLLYVLLLKESSFEASTLIVIVFLPLAELASILILRFLNKRWSFTNFFDGNRTDKFFIFVAFLIGIIPIQISHFITLNYFEIPFDFYSAIYTYVIFAVLFLIVIPPFSVFFSKDKNSIQSEYKQVISNNSILYSLEEEISRQVGEYRDLNNRLFEEIEKRGIAERELAQSKKLLLDAQEYSGIATWEYFVDRNQFKWISYNPQRPILDFNIEEETWTSFASRIHPEDLKYLNQPNETLGSWVNGFEVEIRILNSVSDYRYYLMRGSAIEEGGSDKRLIGLIMDIDDRKKTEQILIEKEQKYRALFDSNIDSVCVIDAVSLAIVDVNPAFEYLYGYSKLDIQAKPFSILTSNADESSSSIDFAKQRGNYRVYQQTHIKSNGDQFLIEANLMMHKVNGRDMLFIISHDITQKRKAEITLAEREQKLRAFFESDLIGMAEISIAKDFLNFNQKLADILGYTPKELYLQNWEDITFPDDYTVESRLFNQALTHKIEGYSVEKRLISKSGELVDCDVSLRAVRTVQSTISHFIVLVKDISDRKKVEKALTESQKQLSYAQSVAKLGSVIFFSNNNILSFSDEAYQIFGYGSKKPRISRKEFFKKLIPNRLARFEEHICNLEKGLPVVGDHEQTIIDANGDIKHLLVNFGVTRDQNNHVIEVLVTMADITRNKNAEIALQETNILKDQLFSIISHDLRSPIASINQLVDLYEKDRMLLDEETSASILQTLKLTSHETFKLLENLLEWANAQRTDSYNPEKTNLVEIANQVIALSTGIAKSKGIELQSNLLTSAPVFVDGEMIKTALRNLISNSIKFTPPKGVVSISINEKDSLFYISVSDTGVGIPDSVVAKLFDNNTSYTTTGTNNEKGTGLGLKLVKKFVEKNGGELTVESTVGKGSIFTFTLPKSS